MSRIYALSSVKFLGLKLRLCKKKDKYEVWPGDPKSNAHAHVCAFALDGVKKRTDQRMNGRIRLFWEKDVNDDDDDKMGRLLIADKGD